MEARSQHKKAKEICICCPLNNLIITPVTCSAFVMEFIKLLTYEKLQIPYPYTWLKSTVDRRKLRNSENNTSTNNICIEKHYKKALLALEFLEDLSRQLHWQFVNEDCCVEEVVLSFGANIACPTETYCLNMPKKSIGHVESNHLNEMSKTVNKIMRNLMLSKEWLKVTESSFPPTNMYVLLRKRQKNLELNENDFFLPKDIFRIPINAKCINIKFDSVGTDNTLCCSNLQIFEDCGDKMSQSPKQNRKSNNDSNFCPEDAQWFAAKSCLKGYKDIFINSRSVSDLW